MVDPQFLLIFLTDSLPVHMDHTDLSRMLSSHLAEYAQFNSVKVIRDSKGGVCAFLQCQDANSAAKLIQTLHSMAPKPFLGRTLRFEAARANRSLLISYRTPTQVISPTDDRSSPEKTVIELKLPFAMRITKFESARNTDIYYDDQAIHFARLPSSTNVVTLLKQPLLCDISPSFVNHCALGNDGDNPSSSSFPSPHDGPRNSHMHQGCFNVKWAHRDDCLSALMVNCSLPSGLFGHSSNLDLASKQSLRRVPHLTVTWAHPQPGREFYPGRYNQPYPMFIRSNSVSTDLSSTTSTSGVAAQSHDTSSMSQTSTCVDPTSHQDVTWISTDFPPLLDRKSEWLKVGKSEREKVENEGAFADDGPSAVQSSSSCRSVLFENMLPPSLSSSGHRSGPSISSTNLPDTGQDFELQNTPDLVRSPVTPKTPSSLVPPTPTSLYVEEHAQPFSKELTRNFSYKSEEIAPGDENTDQMSLFIGGLESMSWDERRIFDIFERFGGLESVKIVRPNSGKAAFAFAKFNNAESPVTAISQMHNRIIDGRAIRVKLRDCTPSHIPYRAGRGRGRYPNFDGHQRHQSLLAETKQDKGVGVSFGEEELSRPAPEDSDTCSAEVSAKDVQDVHPVVVSPQTSPNPEGFREWYELGSNQSSTPAPPFAAGGPFFPEEGSVSPYSVPFFGPWMQQNPPAHPHVQLPMGYYPPMYPVTQNHPRFPGPLGLDLSAPNTLPPAPWYIPYQRYPTRPMDAAGQEQAPVLPTGFFQNETGTLVPVYPQAIIDQYMSNNPSQNDPPIGVPITIPAPIPVPSSAPFGPSGSGLIQPWVQSTFPPHPGFPAGPASFLHQNQMQGHANSSLGWAPSPFTSHRAQVVTPSAVMPIIGMSPFREAFHGGARHGSAGKRPGRQNHVHSRGRNISGRGRGSSNGNTSQSEVFRGRNLPPRGSTQPVTGDWTQWSEALSEMGKSIS
ncbi:hypothetical protein D9757_004610 [Collybiopsis confluens]|uniref:RRM domain-containing protein n=1 Tax=Collybiopsis confluens TaxID=2823264 RepID=A0A8H5MC60_9AGAR|nr:hypothetical protein D9757_004610 [Collybiopsis confluens]